MSDTLIKFLYKQSKFIQNRAPLAVQRSSVTKWQRLGNPIQTVPSVILSLIALPS